ncbi:DUF262 domain-containing protein [Microbacterium sp. NPDC078428]|uniref:DUF262 domain-containing protein n=1 Tax=Microbacterium limosum TaxID=3079935 RepID=A0AAU0MKB8_9MICO|nr:DUF262 domain-containing protein [Microbacterium sp. Y20]WOQ70712.1 DUF262 domain-containing protein [Microbacterium sp. Y20]
MASATNIHATAVNTVAWLQQTPARIVVPVYQRQYRWDIGGCEQLLSDIRAVSDTDERHMHFIGSVLSSTDGTDAASDLVLIDGQQRVTTLMLLVAALRHTIGDDDPALAGELERVLMHAGDRGRTKLQPHRAWQEAFETLVLAREQGDGGASRFADNYAFFRSQINAEEVPRIWQGLRKLEHVAITLGAAANAQQIFASLNSTGEPLRDHELIHNYVLMGLSHAEQSEIEDGSWLEIERNTGESIGAFWRDYLVMKTGREFSVPGEHSVYDAFRQVFPRLDVVTLRGVVGEWQQYSRMYGMLLQPERAKDAEVGRHLAALATLGPAMRPLVMSALHDEDAGVTSRQALLSTLELVQSLLIRRAVVGLDSRRLVARLCRARAEGEASLRRAASRITPSDQRVRVALKFTDLPHAAYVLARMAGTAAGASLQVDHIVPLSPGDGWSGDGQRRWADYTEDEQNSHRALASTLGNLTLLEEDLAERAFDASFPEKRKIYARSGVPLTIDVAREEAWGTAAISQRAAALAARFVEVWPRPTDAAIDDDDLTPILDAQRRRGWPRGWQREFEYTEYCGEHWEVYDVRALFHRVFTRLWADAREDVLNYTQRRGGPVYPAQAWNGEWEALDDDHHLYLGWDSTYMLTAVQGVLEEAGLEPEVFVKYSYIGMAM